MPSIRYENQTYPLNEGESVLECFERHGVDVSSACRAGVCQTCVMKMVEGAPPPESQQGLKPSLQQKGYFLACNCRPQADVAVTRADDNSDSRCKVTVIDKAPLNDDILRLRLKPHTEFDYHAGQFINLHRPDGLCRSYSLASVPGSDEYLELHVEYINDGRMSGWIHDQLKVGDVLTIDGPHGDCFYCGDNPDENLLLLGTGSGLAPLWGILRDAIARGHRGDIHLFHGVRHSPRLYLVEELRTLADKYSNVHYTPCLSRAEPGEGYASGRLDSVVLERYPKLDNSRRIFLCGNPEMVNGMKKKTFLAGASLDHIHADPFVVSST